MSPSFHFYHRTEDLPELTREQWSAINERLRYWVQAKAAHEPRLTDDERAYLRQLDADIWHSALLHRLLFQRKDPLPEPPPLNHSYPDYGEPA